MKQVASARISDLRQQIELEEISARPAGGFKYLGNDSLGRAINGTVPYTSADEARMRLNLSGISVDTLSPVSSFLKRKRNNRPSIMEMAQLAEQFAAQFEIGLTFDRVCRILARVHPNLAIQHALTEVANRILFGQPAHEAFEAQKDKKGNPFFPSTFINAFRIGYEVGALPDMERDDVSADAPVVMLRFFAQAQRRSAEILKKIKSALIYPSSIIGAVIVAFFIEVYWVVPIFAQMFVGLLQGKDATLPLPTNIMLGISDFFRSPFGVGISVLFFAALAWAIYYFFFNQKGVQKRELMVLRLTVFKKFFIPYYASVFCRNLSMLWASEPNMMKRFQTVGQTSTNPVFREMAEHFANQLVVTAPPIGQLFNGHFHLLGESFAAVAETIENAPGTGQKQLYVYAKFLEQESEEQLDLAIAILGKAAFLISAGMVVFILLASYMPLIDLVGKLSKN